MYIKQILEWLLIAAVWVEIIIPGALGRPLFPILRRKSRAKKLLDEQERLRMQLEEDRLQQQVENLKKQHEDNLAKGAAPAKEEEKEKNAQQN